MARTESRQAGPRPPVSPWVPVLAGLGTTFVILVLPSGPETATAVLVLRAALLVAGLVATGAGVWLGLHFAGQEADERARSAGLVALAVLVPLLAYAASPREWDAIRLGLGVLTAVTLSGAVLVLLPAVARRAAVSLLILAHFAGILTAVTDISPVGGAEAPWLANVVWSKFYRYYLQFMYLNNAYHFYSPEPGPPTLLWFHLDYADGSDRWVRLPERDQFHTRQEYQRRLALTESTNMKAPLPPNPFQQQRRRLAGGANLGALMPGLLAPDDGRDAVFIPVMEEFPAQLQWQAALPYSRFMVAAYARHVAHAYPSEQHPGAAVTGVKVYRVVRAIIVPPQMVAGMSPADLTLLQPYYQGEFDEDGNLKDPNDPFLYWHIPIMYYPERSLPASFPKTPDVVVFGEREDPIFGKLLLIDFTKIHVTRKTKTLGSP